MYGVLVLVEDLLHGVVGEVDLIADVVGQLAGMPDLPGRAGLVPPVLALVLLGDGVTVDVGHDAGQHEHHYSERFICNERTGD